YQWSHHNPNLHSFPTRRSSDLPALKANGKIAFVSDRDGNFEIYVMDADGSNQTRLTNNPAHDGEPAWSPDGAKIVFVSQRDGNRSEEHTSELQSRENLVCRLLL